MRATILVYFGWIALGSISSLVACSSSEPEPPMTSPPDSGGIALGPEDAGQRDPEDSGRSGAEAGPGTEVQAPKCTDAGWCETSLPDEDLVLKDVWPLDGRAFAIAYSLTLGVKVLEWKESDAAWSYIDDGTQNEDFAQYVGRIWAPNENEVYYGVDPGYIYHGTRPTPPATKWSWTRQRLKDNSHADIVHPQDGYPKYFQLNANYPTLGIWGTSVDDVYAWFTDTIYRRTKFDGDTFEWVPEYIANDASGAAEHMYFVAATGSGPDDLWFSGTRTRSPSLAACAVLVHRTGGDYLRIADGVLSSNTGRCAAKPGYLSIGGAEGWLTDIHMRSVNEIVGLKGARDVVKVSIAEGGYSVSVATVPMALDQEPLSSLWADPGSLWLSGFGTVVRASGDVWDGGAFQLSSVAVTGAPLGRHLYQVRGTSNTNLWAIGVRNALHKTTP
ncbi:MAG: hypothetical protein BGO98_21875 [Myxococcales bacterium 68-20]|nr:hypothetical protein [Myxococcales bacterium]OJY15105.1 MAG: hypothetical protein BGO98_21875 [Myxococcales bacterium 68-20]